MILKYKFYKENNNLVAYQSYTLAQHSHLADQISIISNDPQATSYNYCLEFVCYNTKNIPKTQYITAILEYGTNGLEFEIPNNLTQFRGHTDIQLTAYDKTNANIVFKSVAKNSKAFDVEGSLCVLENSISDTPNVITEIMSQLDYLSDIRENLVEEFFNKANSEFSGLLSRYNWKTVTFWDRDEIVSQGAYVYGHTITPPADYVPPKNTIISGGWYDLKTETLWDFENTVITDNLDLIINYHTDGVLCKDNTWTDYIGTNKIVYIPHFNGDYPVELTDSRKISSTTDGLIVYYNIYIYDTKIFNESTNIYSVFIPEKNTMLKKVDQFVVSKDGYRLYTVCNKKSSDYVPIPPSCSKILPFAIKHLSAKKLSLSNSITYLPYRSITTCYGLFSITLPLGLHQIDICAISDCVNLYAVYCLCPLPPTMHDRGIIKNADNHPNPLKPIIFVLPEYLKAYRSADGWKTYTIEPIGGIEFDDIKEQANTYTDTKTAQNLLTAKTYCDDKVRPLSFYTDEKCAETLQAAKTYTDEKNTAMLAYVNQKVADALKAAKDYTDQKITT